ncbi:MAG: DNA cytosine methyltransferase [Ghiorsea sp.]
MTFPQKSVSEIIETSKQEKFKVISLFAGGGGSSMGYRLAGGKILAINEFVEHAISTYRLNFPDTPIIGDDVRTISGAQLMELGNIKKGELDIMDGSPPCSGFSVNGKGADGWGKAKKYSTGKTQVVDDLFFEYARILNDIQPKVFIAENVPAIMNSGNKKKCATIYHALSNCGYDVHMSTLTSSDFLTPQKRSRLFIVGLRNDLDINPMLAQQLIYPEPYKKNITLANAFSDIDYTLPENIIGDNQVSDKIKKLWETTVEGQFFDTACNKLYGVNSYFNYIKLNRNGFSSTITTHNTYFHWEECRRILLSEARRIAGVPDDYQFSNESEAISFERLGRMVTPNVMCALSTNIYNNILSKI